MFVLVIASSGVDILKQKFFTGQTLVLSSNQQHQSIEGTFHT